MGGVGAAYRGAFWDRYRDDQVAGLPWGQGSERCRDSRRPGVPAYGHRVGVVHRAGVVNRQGVGGRRAAEAGPFQGLGNQVAKGEVVARLSGVVEVGIDGGVV